MREMKDSGIEWIGAIPINWDIAQFKKILIRNDGGLWGNDPSGQDDILVLRSTEQTIDGKWDIQSPAYRDLSNVSNVQEYLVKCGDLLITKSSGSDLHIGKTTIVDELIESLHCSFSNFIQRLRVCSKMNPRYYWYILNSNIARGQFVYLQNSTSGIGNINSKNINEIEVPIPPLDIQHTIADYLDRKCSQIDAIIARQQEVIEKLKAYKLSVITEAVTKGLNPDVPMKDSGVEWIGEIPVHWTIGQLKHYASLRAGLTLGKKYPPNSKLVEVPYLRVANVQGDYVKLDDIADVSVLPEEIEKYSLHKNELLMTEGGDRDKLGRGCIWNGEIQPCLHQNHVFAVTTDTSKLRIEFLNYVTSSNVARVYFDYTAKKTTNLASTNSTVILQFKLPIPPIKEQDSVVSYLETKCTEIDRCLSNTELIISKLQNYKKSLIYEIVTGKKEV